MTDDDKNIGPGGVPEDPWAGLDVDGAANGGDSFEFPDFESLVDDRASSVEPAAVPEPDALHEPDVSPTVDSAAPGDERIIIGESESGAEAFGVPGFDALSLGEQDGVFADEPAWTGGDPLAGLEAEPLGADEPPLAVFPPAEAGLRPENPTMQPEEQELLPTGGLIDVGNDGDTGNDGDADALAHLEDAAGGEADPGIVAFTQPEPWPATESSLIGTEDSLVVGDVGGGDVGADDVGAAGGESLVDQSLVDRSTIQIGTGQSGILPFEDWSESPDATSTDASTDSTNDENPFGISAFDGDNVLAGGDNVLAGGDGSPAGDGLGDLAGAGGAVAATIAAPKVRKVVKKRSGGGAIGLILSIVLGGALSIPIVIGLLFWVWKKDPFKIAPSVPASLAFLLPAEFQIAGQGSRTPPRPAVRDETLVASRSLDDLVNDDGAATENSPPAAASEETTVPQEGGTTDETAVADDGLFATNPKTSEPQASEPPPLDTSALDAALAAADKSTSRLLGTSVEDPAYKRLLKDWYTTVSKVGEETVALEQKAADTGAEFVAVSPAATRTIGRILGDERASEQFAKLSRMWLKSRGRTSDGVVMPAVFGSSRHVGAWWVSRVRISDDPEVPEVAVLSRTQPDASEGDAVVVLGLVFEPGVVWAAACGRFEPLQGAAAEDGTAGEGAAANDLFPTE